MRRTIQKRRTKSGQAAYKACKYKYEDGLQFLIPYLGEREGISNISKPQEDEEFSEDMEDDEMWSEERLTPEASQQKKTNKRKDSEDAGCSQLESPTIADPGSYKRAKKQKNSEDTASSKLMSFIISQKSKEQGDDAVHAFLNGLAHPLKTLSLINFLEAKRKLFDVVHGMELKQIRENGARAQLDEDDI